MSKISKLKDIASNYSVLYVEDDKKLRERVVVFLKKFFKDVTSAVDGQDGLKQYTGQNLVISDINMPKMNGLEMSKNIKSLNEEQNIIIISAYSEVSYFLESIQIGVDGYILKPVNNDQLIDVIYKIVEKIDTKKRLENEIEINKKKDLLIFEQAKMASIGNMIGRISHQWRQPLNEIGVLIQEMYLDLKLQNLDKNLDLHIKSNILDKLSYLSKTIDYFRNYIQKGEDNKEVNLKDVIESALGVVEATLKNNDIDFINNIDLEAFEKNNTIHSNLSEVLINIFNNSIDFFVSRDIKDRWIKLDMQRDENKITISIEDNAGGIADKIFSSLFEPYSSTKYASQGRGLGLYISYKIVTELLNGELYVKNSDNGAKFYIELPLS